MSQASSQASIFYREVAQTRSIWTVKDDSGFPAPKNSSGQRVQPFWSTRSRLERIISTVPAYAGFSPFEVSWEKFCQAWVPGLEGDGLLVGVNWSGERAAGYDLTPGEVQRNVEAAIATEADS